MRRLIVCLLLALVFTGARSGELIVIVDTGTEMPYAKFDGGRVIGGIHFDVGMALARHLQRTPRFQALPRKRINFALEDGAGDVLCMYLPAWMPGNFDWSQPFFPQSEVLLSVTRVARPKTIGDVAGQLVGTVHGYRYPEMEAALGAGFRRSDGPSTEINLQKLAAGRIDHALSSELWFRYRMRQGDIPLRFHPPLVIESVMTSCAVSRAGRVKVVDVNAALAAMQRDGTVAAILRRY